MPPVAAIVDAIRGYHFHHSRLGHLVPEHRTNCRSAKDDEAYRRGHGVSGKSQQRAESDVAERERFPRFHADLPDRNLTFRFEDVLHQVEVPQ